MFTWAEGFLDVPDETDVSQIERCLRIGINYRGRIMAIDESHVTVRFEPEE